MLNDNKDLKKKLKALTDLIIQQAEQNPEFGEAITEILGIKAKTKKETATKKDSEPLPDPFVYFQENGEDKLRIWLENFDVSNLKAMVRQHRFDPSRLSDRWKKKQRFIDLITERVQSRVNQGDSFRHYTERQGQQ